MKIRGDARTWRIAGEGENEKIHAFCPTCGTPVCVTFSEMPGITAIHAGSLDDPGLFNPGAVTYTCRAQKWDVQAPSLVAFETMPAD